MTDLELAITFILCGICCGTVGYLLRMVLSDSRKCNCRKP